MITRLTDAALILWSALYPGTSIVTLEGNRTLDCPTDIVEGADYTLIVEQDSTGGRSLAFDACYAFPGSVVPALSTGPSDRHILSFVAESDAGLTLKSVTSSVGTVVVPPSGLVAVGGTGSATLSWTDNSGDETGFVIEWLVDPMLGQWVEIGSVGGGSTGFLHEDLPGEYTYRVKAVRNGAKSLPSNTYTATIE
jgi:hypothetical protein